MKNLSITIDSVITQLGDLKTDACTEAAKILYALSESGVHTAEEAKDLVYDYNALAKQYQAMHKRFGTAGHAVHKDGIWHCPSCNRKVTPGHSFCHWCGKKMAWSVNRKGGRKGG